jgi:hypothetical protein
MSANKNRDNVGVGFWLFIFIMLLGVSIVIIAVQHVDIKSFMGSSVSDLTVRQLILIVFFTTIFSGRLSRK